MVAAGVVCHIFVRVNVHKVLVLDKVCDGDGDAQAGIVGGRVNSTERASLDWVVEAAHDIGWMGMHLVEMDALRCTVAMAGWGESASWWLDSREW